MNPEKAIETLAELREIVFIDKSENRREAVNLGIGALDFVLTIRAGSEGKFPPLLPGETEE